MSVRNYHYSLCDNPEERGSHLLRGGSLKLRTARKFFYPESGESRLFNPFLILYETFNYLPIYSYVFQAVSFLPVS